ncbi:MAG: hypothetical protein EA352_10710, partial [Gemmatimonadales bacterium]
VLLLGAAFAAPLGTAGAEGQSAPAEDEYRVYVGAESADLLHRVRLGPDGLQVEATIPVSRLWEQSGIGHLQTEHESPHGVAVDADGGIVWMTTGHGLPDGKLWKVEAGTGRLLADPLDLGRFPASVDVSPDGRTVWVANFNLHGRMEPSSISVVWAPDMVEIARIDTCTMPHGSRVHPRGHLHYSTCMMDDQLVEIGVEALEVTRRLLLTPGAEEALDPGDMGVHGGHHGDGHDHGDHGADDDDAHDHDAHHHDDAHGDHGDDPARGPELPVHPPAECSPTWVQPSHGGDRAWVACNRSDQVVEVDLERWEVTRRFDTGRGPYNVDVTADDRLLVVTLKQGDAVEVLDLEAGRTVASLPTSTTVVHGIALSPDSRWAFISVEGVGDEPGRVDVVDLESLEVAASVEVGQQASGIGFWQVGAAGGARAPAATAEGAR